VLTGPRVGGSPVSLRLARPQTPRTRRCPVPGNLAQSESVSGTWWRVSAGLLHFPAGNAARWRHQAHRIAGCKLDDLCHRCSSRRWWLQWLT